MYLYIKWNFHWSLSNAHKIKPKGIITNTQIHHCSKCRRRHDLVQNNWFVEMSTEPFRLWNSWGKWCKFHVSVIMKIRMLPTPKSLYQDHKTPSDGSNEKIEIPPLVRAKWAGTVFKSHFVKEFLWAEFDCWPFTCLPHTIYNYRCWTPNALLMDPISPPILDARNHGFLTAVNKF
jgi:hypothetical protein